MTTTARIRTELLLRGPMYPCELSVWCGRERNDVHPYLSQLRRAKKDPVIQLPDGRYALARTRCRLGEVW